MRATAANFSSTRRRLFPVLRLCRYRLRHHAQSSHPHRSPGSRCGRATSRCCWSAFRNSPSTSSAITTMSILTSPTPISCCASRRPWPTTWCATRKKLKWIQALGTGVDNIVDLPSLGPEVVVTNIRGIHGAPVSEATIAYMLSLARDMPRSVHAQDRSEWDALAGATARRQDRRHSRRRADRGISGADLQGARHDGGRHHRQPAPDARLRPHGQARRPGRGRARARFPGGAGPDERGDPPHHRREGVRRHEADRLSRQRGARRRGRRAGA